MKTDSANRLAAVSRKQMKLTADGFQAKGRLEKKRRGPFGQKDPVVFLGVRTAETGGLEQMARRYKKGDVKDNGASFPWRPGRRHCGKKIPAPSGQKTGQAFA